MLPQIVLFNSVSVDGAIKDFDLNIKLHYKLAGKVDAQAMLVGSDTAKSGIELFTNNIPKEIASDLVKPEIRSNDDRLFWVIADSRGKLCGLLHVLRQSDFLKDVIVLVSASTPIDYLHYLAERNYDYIVAGSDHVNYRVALEELNRQYGFDTIIADTGGTLASILLEQELVNELRLLITPEIVGNKAVCLFRGLKKKLKLELIKAKRIGGHLLVIYNIKQVS